ncbi:rCG20705, isoform CRA_f [Rattus norvegicus]|uniref:RCG20705, isoform CRA_f n=1 Tax=Rattus norvegicus TaxID=10116 RepID=A6JDV9_RAT|nr:rCG20705, isoform CRA_f [Rattus norvegicus]
MKVNSSRLVLILLFPSLITLHSSIYLCSSLGYHALSSNKAVTLLHTQLGKPQEPVRSWAAAQALHVWWRAASME